MKTEVEKEAFVKSYASNIAYYPSEKVREYMEAHANDVQLEYAEQCSTSVYDAECIWNDAVAFEQERTQMAIRCLFDSLMESWGNENVYDREGNVIPLDEIKEMFPSLKESVEHSVDQGYCTNPMGEDCP